MILYFVRHGDPTYSPDCLTPLGHRQAEAVGRRLARHGIDQIYASPLVRAQQTAKPTSELMKLEIQTEEWTSESLAWQDFSCDFPDGRRRWCCARQASEFKTSEMQSLTAENWYDIEMLKGTNAAAGYQRIVDGSDDFFRRLGYVRDGAIYHIERANEDRVALFAHAGFGIIWLAHMFNLIPIQTWGTFDLCHSGITVFEFRNNDNGITSPLCLCHSDISHLCESGLPTKYNNRLYL